MPGQSTAIAAMLWDKWAMGPSKFVGWTDWQIRKLCFHKRDKDGHIVLPEDPTSFEEEVTPESELALINQLQAMFGGNLKGAEEGKAKIKARMEEKEAPENKDE